MRPSKPILVLQSVFMEWLYRDCFAQPDAWAVETSSISTKYPNNNAWSYEHIKVKSLFYRTKTGRNELVDEWSENIHIILHNRLVWTESFVLALKVARLNESLKWPVKALVWLEIPEGTPFLLKFELRHEYRSFNVFASSIVHLGRIIRAFTVHNSHQQSLGYS